MKRCPRLFFLATAAFYTLALGLCFANPIVVDAPPDLPLPGVPRKTLPLNIDMAVMPSICPVEPGRFALACTMQTPVDQLALMGRLYKAGLRDEADQIIPFMRANKDGCVIPIVIPEGRISMQNVEDAWTHEDVGHCQLRLIHRKDSAHPNVQWFYSDGRPVE